MRHLTLAVRTLLKTPFVTVVAVVSLALGIGANAAIFSLFDQMLLKPLPVQAPGDLVNLAAPGPKPGPTSCNQAGDCTAVFSYGMFRDLEREQQVFTGMAAHRAFGANLAHQGQTTSNEGMRENVFMDRMIATLSSAFAILATLLAAVGLYGVLAYTVTQRTREIGLRMALGADGPRVRGMLLRQVAKMTLVGGLAGLAAAIGIGTFAKSLLFEIEGYDPTVVAVSVVLLAMVAMTAGLIPALKASRIDPMVALRYE